MSIHKNEPEIIQAAIDSNFYDVVLTAINFKHALADQIKEKAALASKQGIGVIAMKTMAGGFYGQGKTKAGKLQCRIKMGFAGSKFSHFHTRNCYL